MNRNGNEMKQIYNIKPNSHQTIFPTDFLRQPTIEKSVINGHFLKK